MIAIASALINACSTAAGSIRLLLFARFSSMSEFSSPSVQYLHLIFASSPTLTERVIIHNDINDMTNSVAGTENEIKNSRHVFPKSKRAKTISGSFCKVKDEENKRKKNKKNKQKHRIHLFVHSINKKVRFSHPLHRCQSLSFGCVDGLVVRCNMNT